MNFKLVKSNKFGALLGALTLLALIPGAAFADFTVTYVLSITTNWPGSVSFGWEQAQIQEYGRWGVFPNPITNRSGYTTPVLPNSPPDYFVDFRTMTNYYVPSQQSFTLTANTNLTNYYIPYSNILSVTVAGTNGMVSPVVWSFSTAPGELNNSTAYKTAYTNNVTLTPVPTGQYTVAFPAVAGWTTPSGPTTFTNITGASPVTNYITGTYARVRGTITVTVTPTNGSWSFTAYPADFTNYSGSALSGTNSGTLTNAPVGVYTIHYNDLGGTYVTPANQTQTNTIGSTNLSFVGTYTIAAQSWLTVDFNPPAVRYPVDREWAHWRVATSAWMDHHESVHLDNGFGYWIYYSNVKDYYIPSPYWLANMFGDITITNTYIPYTNSLSVVIAGITDGSTSTWQIAQFAEFTNSSAYKTRYTNSQYLFPIPTGTYAITFNDVFGYTTPSNITTSITGAPNSTVTGTYSRITNGTINIQVSLSNASWTITTHPSDYTSPPYPMSGTGNLIISNVPLGTYVVTFGPVAGYTTPDPQTRTVTAGATGVFTGNYTFTGYNLTVMIRQPFPRQSALPGIGGPENGCMVSYPGYSGPQTIIEQSYPVVDGAQVTLTAMNLSSNFVYKWYINNYTTLDQRGDEQIDATIMWTNSYTFPMRNHVEVWLLYSRPFLPYDNAGDIDQDGLPDKWEVSWFGDGGNTYSAVEPPAESIKTPYGHYDNQDNDFIPSASIIPPSRVATVLNEWDYTGIGGNAGYPLTRSRMLTTGLAYYQPGSLGYANGVKFNNYLECRGLDGYYLNNVPPGGPVYSSPKGDDPMTDPLDNDTDNDEMWDGWEYYFWYWRSASAYTAGITNSANFSWVHIAPCDAREFVQTGGDWDTDGDAGPNIGTDLDEFHRGTDPTHADTDGDGMDDYWEIFYCGGNSNALDSANGQFNPDGDFYATVPNVFVLTTGMTGTAFTNAVYYAANMAGVWINNYTNTGSNVFDLYRDTIIKATVALTDHQTGTIYTNTVFYGTTAGLGAFQQGYPVWVDMNGNSNYDLGVDVAIINPPIKHEALYLMAPAAPGPGITSFDPRTAWTNLITSATNAPEAAPNTVPYTTYQEYLGGDYIGRLSWDAGGQVTAQNDPDFVAGSSRDRNSYTLPNNQDTDGDQIPDGWELYVGLNPNDAGDAIGDGDGDKLINFDEWSNATHPLGTCLATWPNKHWPTDPGVLKAPSPNDPHPVDTDWDGLDDNAEKGINTDPDSFDTDNDMLPDGWEVYAGSNPANSDASVDTDGDGLLNWQEYLTGAVSEWMYCDASWGLNFMCRPCMSWEPLIKGHGWPFIPPDFLSDPSFILVNGIITNLAYLRIHYPAAGALGSAEYHTTLANNQDSDQDGMDDFWEVYHGLNPCKGLISLMIPIGPGPIPYRFTLIQDQVSELDADVHSDARDFQVGFSGNPFTSPSEMFFALSTTNLFGRAMALDSMVGPFNCGLTLMDPDADGLPNLEEYSYSSNRPFYHTDPSPFWRTDRDDNRSFVRRNYFESFNGGSMHAGGFSPSFHVSPFSFEGGEGFDTDHDGRSDYSEINSAVGETGDDPLDARNPIRNRALFLDGIRDFARTPDAWGVISEGYLTRFCAEAWIKPDNPLRPGEQIIIERASWIKNQFGAPQLSANFKLGLTNGLAFIMYNGRGALRVHQATAALRHQIQSKANWTHIAGVYNGSDLTIYVNGESSASVHTEEIPDNGIDSSGTNAVIFFRGSSVIIGAEDTNPAGDVNTTAPRSYFGGCIDEVRVWNGPRSQADIIANKGQELSRDTVAKSPLFVYCTFDNVPDPYHRNSAGVLDEPVAPNYMTALDQNMQLHPTITWWRDCLNRSTVYTGVNGSYNYIVYAENHAEHVARVPPYDDFVHVNTNAFSTNSSATNVVSALPADYKNTSNPYGTRSATDRIPILTDFYLFLGARGVATNSWLGSLDPTNPDSTDSDGDCLPDWWEIKYGLDPKSATGDNGKWGDPDHDGLSNQAEYLAGTDPRNSDTYGTGVGDYDYPRRVYSRTYGEMYGDGDGMPDVWESQNGVDPQKYDANLDLDGDGWSNYQEYLASTDPASPGSFPQPHISGLVSYYGNQSGIIRVLGYHTSTMDGTPQTYQYGLDSQVSEVAGYADGTLTFSGVLPFAPVSAGTIVTISAIMYWLEANGGTTYSYITYTFTGPSTFTYAGRTSGAGSAGRLDYNTGKFTLTWGRDEVPYKGNEVSVSYGYSDPRFPRFSIVGFKEGDVYLMAYMDVNNNQSWDVGEPLGLAQDMPFNLKWSNISDVRIQLLDTAPGFGRFAWTATGATNSYPVVITRLSESGAPTILQRSMTGPRNYFHEWDFQLAGIEGLMAGTYQWWMGSQNGTFPITWPAPASLATPALVYPRGAVLYYAQSEFAWTMDLRCPRAHIQIARGAADGALVTDKYVRAPWRDAQGISRSDLAEYANEWGNGVYYWRVAGWTPQGESAWSDWQSFSINLSSTYSYWVTGDIYYYGKAPATKIIVEAFANRGFSGRPVARMTLTPPTSTGWVKCSYAIYGLKQGGYYVRAFLDVTPVGSIGPNNKLDFWESEGFYRDPNNFYQAGLVNLNNAQFIDNARIIIRDKDTDNDKMPDAWEMAYFGNLDQTGDMDYDGDGESNLDEYIKDGVNMNPASWDSDGDGVSDWLELHYNGAAFGFARNAKSVGTTLGPTVWDTDGDGYSDGAELFRYHTDPLDPTSYPRYRPLCTDAWPSPGDYDGDGRTDVGVYDFNSGVWSLITMAGQSVALPFGIKGAQPMVGDYTGDGRSEFAFYDKGIWSLNTLNGQSATLKFGDASMLPAPADYTGAGRMDLAVFDTDSGMWYIYDIWSGALISGQFGTSGMIPVPGDYNGDGAADLALYEPATGNWLLGCNHKYYHTWTVLSGTLGGPTWMPVPGDYDGDGRNDVCLFEEATGRWMLFTMNGQFAQGVFGWKGCVPVPGDYDGDGRTDLAIYDKNTGMWYIHCMSGAYYEGRFGWPGAMPIMIGR